MDDAGVQAVLRGGEHQSRGLGLGLGVGAGDGLRRKCRGLRHNRTLFRFRYGVNGADIDQLARAVRLTEGDDVRRAGHVDGAQPLARGRADGDHARTMNHAGLLIAGGKEIRETVPVGDVSAGNAYAGGKTRRGRVALQHQRRNALAARRQHANDGQSQKARCSGNQIVCKHRLPPPVHHIGVAFLTRVYYNGIESQNATISFGGCVR